MSLQDKKKELISQLRKEVGKGKGKSKGKSRSKPKRGRNIRSIFELKVNRQVKAPSRDKQEQQEQQEKKQKKQNQEKQENK